MNRPSSRELLSRYCRGDSAAAAEIFDRYVRRLIELTRARISPRLARRIDPQDVVQSAYRSFFIRARERPFVLRRSGDLWRLLATIAVHKLHAQLQRHRAQRRDMQREQELFGGQAPAGGFEAATPEPTPQEQAALMEQLQMVMRRCAPVQRRALEMRLQGQTIEAIAHHLHRSQRTVRRLLENVRQDLERELAKD